MLNNTEKEKKEAQSKEKPCVPTYTHLKEIYSDFQKNREEIEPVYENMRKKFKSVHKCEAEFYCRIPYAISLFGDEVTKLYDDKIVTTIEKDLITCANRNKDKLKIKFETYDVMNNIGYIVDFY